MKNYALILVLAAAGSLLVPEPACAQSTVDPGIVNPSPGPQLPDPMPYGDPPPNAVPMPGGGPMPYPPPMPYPSPLPNQAPIPNAGPMPPGYPPPGMGPMPGQMPPPNQRPMSNYGLDPYGVMVPHGGQMPGGPQTGDQIPPGAFPYVPPRIIHYGWPSLRIYRRDVPMPEPKPDATNRATKFVHPRSARLEIRTNSPARIYVDGEELDCIDGVFLVEPDHPLIPGVPYMHSVRVEGFDRQGREIARTVVVYLRKGRVTELTFY